MLQRIIKIVIWLILAALLILAIIYGLSTSDFANLKKYDKNEYGINDVREMMQNPSKRKQEIAKERFYTNRVTIKSSTMANLGDFTVNIAGDKKLILNISLKYKDKSKESWLSTKSAKDEILAKGDILRDAVIHTFSNSSNARASNHRMKKELIENINAYLSDTEVEEVYFNRFLIH